MNGIADEVSFRLSLHFQLQTTSASPSNGCNRTLKPRVRARRGQATDPHSIAERVSLFHSML